MKNNVGADREGGENKAFDYVLRRNDFVLDSVKMCFHNAEPFLVLVFHGVFSVIQTMNSELYLHGCLMLIRCLSPVGG